MGNQVTSKQDDVLYNFFLDLIKIADDNKQADLVDENEVNNEYETEEVQQ